MSSAGGAGRTSDDDLFLLLILGMLGLSAAGAAAHTWWTQVVAWLLKHQVVLAAGEHPLLTLPYSGGAGLDEPRLALAVAGLLLLLAASAGAVRSRLRAGRLQ